MDREGSVAGFPLGGRVTTLLVPELHLEKPLVCSRTGSQKGFGCHGPTLSISSLVYLFSFPSPALFTS
jgi:hypothetical protein